MRKPIPIVYGPDYSLLPFAIRKPMQAWIERGEEPGAFLSAVFRNDLVGAVTKADPYHLPRLRDIIHWMLSEAPPRCYGAEEAFTRWRDAGGNPALSRPTTEP